MNMKRMFGVLVLGIFLISMMSGVLGDEQTAEEAGEIAGEGLMSIVTFVKALTGSLSVDTSFDITSTQIFTYILFAILIAMLVYSSSGLFFDEGSAVHWIATVAISALAIIAIPLNILEVILVQYGAMGATLLTAIPFVIVAFFTLKVKNLAIAYMTWIFYVMYYIVLFFTAISEVGFLTKAAIPYWFSIIAGIVAFIFMGYFRKWLFGIHLESDVELAEAGLKKKTAQRKLETAELDSRTEALKAAGS
ncbi:hypothetical protein HNV12_02670 [Methanococcoides sp. SA1]|nr:hypothetical protein [Methanococcoides sp. SA1]